MTHCATNTDAFRAHGVMLVPGAFTVPRLAFTDIEDHDTSRLPALDPGLHREREPEPRSRWTPHTISSSGPDSR